MNEMAGYMQGAMGQFPAVTKTATEKATESIIQMSQAQMEMLTTASSQAQATLSQLGAFMAASSQAATQSFRNSQQKQLEVLEKKKDQGIISEEEFQRRREQLEEKTQRKIAQEQRQAAKRQKALSIFQSITNTAVAVTKALAQSANPILAGIIGAFGAAQTALIAAQPIPEFATGGSFETSGPQLIQVGDNPGGRERVTVEPTSSSIGGGQPIHVTVTMGRKVLIDTVKQASRSGELLIDARSVV
jgi:primosomal protein N'